MEVWTKASQSDWVAANVLVNNNAMPIPRSSIFFEWILWAHFRMEGVCLTKCQYNLSAHFVPNWNYTTDFLFFFFFKWVWFSFFHLQTNSDSDLQLPSLWYTFAVGTGIRPYSCASGPYSFIRFITVSDLVSNVAGKGPPALYLKHAWAGLEPRREMSVSVTFQTQLGIARLRWAPDTFRVIKVAHKLFYM